MRYIKMTNKMKIWLAVIVIGVPLVWGLLYQHFAPGGSGSDCQSTNSCSAPSGGGGYDPGITDDHPADHPAEAP
jgi:hypothetical protein